MGICHRILVFSDGRITGDVPRAEFAQERILSLAYQEYVRNVTQHPAAARPAASAG
jgi:ribose transport system ATP-binding protein